MDTLQPSHLVMILSDKHPSKWESNRENVCNDFTSIYKGGGYTSVSIII